MSSPTSWTAGSVLITADGVVGTSGAPTRVFAIHVISDASAAVPLLENGTAASNTTWIKETGTANTGKTFTYGDHGILFPDGCNVDCDANTISVLVSYAQ